MELVVRLVALAGILLLVQELFRRADKWAAWGAFFVLPLALAPYWVELGQVGAYRGSGAFPWVKLVSLQIGASWLTALRFTSLGRAPWALGALFLMLPLNMLEAVTEDLFGGHPAHYVLALSGILLIFSVPHPMKAIRIDSDGRYRDLQYVGMTRPWIAGYTLWNAAFVYLNFPAIAGHELAVLSSAFAIGMYKPSRWLQARTFTLATDLLAMATFPSVIIPFAETSDWASPQGENVVAGVCLALVAVYAVCIFRRRAARLAARSSQR